MPDCVTVNVCPAMFNVPVLELVLVLEETEYDTVPLPLPLPPDVIVIQDALLDAVQLQPLVVVTLTLPVPPLELTELLLVGEIE